jgi:hypothetical protein
MQRVARDRDVTLVPLGPELAGYSAPAQQRWRAWLRRHHLEGTAPVEFSAILGVVIPFADQAMTEGATRSYWNRHEVVTRPPVALSRGSDRLRRSRMVRTARGRMVRSRCRFKASKFDACLQPSAR